MKAQELRIGNLISQNGFFGYVYSIESALPRQEERFSDKDLVTLFDNGITTVPIEEVKPIELTEEWLIKFNWVLNPILNEYHGNNMILYNRNKYVSYGVTKLYYVHQLQNLYFALTGVELELSSNVA